MKHLLTFLILGIAVNSFAQIDYVDLRSEFTLSCGSYDSLDLFHNEMFIDSISQLDISEGKEKFLYDKAWLYYCKYRYYKQIDDYQLAYDIWSENWIQNKNLSSLWNMSGASFLIDCKESLRLTELYIKTAKENNKDLSGKYEQIYLRYKECHDEILKTNANQVDRSAPN